MTVATIADSLTHAEIIALAVPWRAVPDVLRAVGPALSGKILIDCTNPFKERDELDRSGGQGGQLVAQLAPGARGVKAFNTTGLENMRNPTYPEGPVAMFYAGDDMEAKKIVQGFAADPGFDPVDAGALAQSSALEVMASLWGGFGHGTKDGTRNRLSPDAA